MDETTDRIIEMAWEDRTPFEAIEHQFGLAEKRVDCTHAPTKRTLLKGGATGFVGIY